MSGAVRPPLRVLFLTPPGVGHLFPVVPSAWAARGAGAHVLVGSTAAAVGAAAGAGLAAVDVCPGVDLAPLRETFVRRMPAAAPDTRFALAMEMFAAISDAMADGALELARAWRPDLVMFTPLQAAGPLVAEALDIPGVEHGFQLTGVGRTQHLLEPHLAGTLVRLGVERLRPPATALDICPPSVLVGPPHGRVMGYQPYNGGRQIRTDLLHEPRRRRIVVTTGTAFEDEAAQRRLLALMAEVDAEVLLAGDPPAQRLPGNVVAPGWVPLDTVLPDADLLVHHGGAGTALTGLRAGVPQVVASQGADHDFNAMALTRRGVGIRGVEDLAGAVDTALSSAAMRSAAAEVAEEMAGLDAPALVVPQLLQDLCGAVSRPGTPETIA